MATPKTEKLTITLKEASSHGMKNHLPFALIGAIEGGNMSLHFDVRTSGKEPKNLLCRIGNVNNETFPITHKERGWVAKIPSSQIVSDKLYVGIRGQSPKNWRAIAEIAPQPVAQ